jgi:hypothetical protein
MTFGVDDDGFHEPGSGAGWEESWTFDWWSEDGAAAGFLRHGAQPAAGVAWFWFYVFPDLRSGRSLVAVRDHDIPLGRWGRFEHRSHGLWFQARPEVPMTAWSIQVEAFGLGVDDPAELAAAEVGRPTALGLDVGFEASAPAVAIGDNHYWQVGTLAGDVLMGPDVVAFDGIAVRQHHWGMRDWSVPYPPVVISREGVVGAAGSGPPVEPVALAPVRLDALILWRGPARQAGEPAMLETFTN